ncbi:MAG: hypothetical protein WEC39_00550 [Patescibacteria group bacterium]
MPNPNPEVTTPVSAGDLNLPKTFNFKFAAFAAVVALLNLGLGWALERVFAAGFRLELSMWARFLPLVLVYLLTSSTTLIFAATLPFAWRQVGYTLAALGFGLPFLLPPHPVNIPTPFVFIFMVVHLVGLTVFDFYTRQTIKNYAVFIVMMFWSTFNRLFLGLTLIVGFLVYFSATIPADLQFKIPQEYLDPALNLVINQVIGQVQSELGTEKFTEEQFLAQLRETGLLELLQQQYGIDPKDLEFRNPQDLVESLREPLAVQLSRDVEESLNNILEPYLPYLPLAAAVGVLLSLLFLSPILGYLAVGFFAVFYRTLVWAKILEFKPEMRPVSVLKLK